MALLSQRLEERAYKGASNVSGLILMMTNMGWKSQQQLNVKQDIKVTNKLPMERSVALSKIRAP